MDVIGVGSEPDRASNLVDLMVGRAIVPSESEKQEDRAGDQHDRTSRKAEQGPWAMSRRLPFDVQRLVGHRLQTGFDSLQQ
jgi:hypothetical protein